MYVRAGHPAFARLCVGVHKITSLMSSSLLLRAKYKIFWESLGLREKWDNLKKASLLNKRNPTNANMQKLKKAKNELTNTYQKGQFDYIQDQIDKIWNPVEDSLSWIV